MVAAMLNFGKTGILGYSNHGMWSMFIITSNLKQMSSLTTEIWPKIQVKDGGRRHLEFCSVPNLKQISSLRSKIWPKIQNVRWRPPPSWILAKVYFWCKFNSLANVDLYTKFGGNRSRNGWDIPVYVHSVLKKLCKIVFVRTSSNFHQFW